MKYVLIWPLVGFLSGIYVLRERFKVNGYLKVGDLYAGIFLSLVAGPLSLIAIALCKIDFDRVVFKKAEK